MKTIELYGHQSHINIMKHFLVSMFNMRLAPTTLDKITIDVIYQGNDFYLYRFRDTSS